MTTLGLETELHRPAVQGALPSPSRSGHVHYSSSQRRVAMQRRSRETSPAARILLWGRFRSSTAHPHASVTQPLDSPTESSVTHSTWNRSSVTEPTPKLLPPRLRQLATSRTRSCPVFVFVASVSLCSGLVIWLSRGRVCLVPLAAFAASAATRRSICCFTCASTSSAIVKTAGRIALNSK
jgi:hypothetical protein